MSSARCYSGPTDSLYTKANFRAHALYTHESSRNSKYVAKIGKEYRTQRPTENVVCKLSDAVRIH